MNNLAFMCTVKFSPYPTNSISFHRQEVTAMCEKVNGTNIAQNKGWKNGYYFQRDIRCNQMWPTLTNTQKT